MLRTNIRKAIATSLRRTFSSTPLIVTTIAEYRALRHKWTLDGKSVGFVPTMGALHAGHLSLAGHARKGCDIVVSSIFVNPAQFAPTEDLAKYPRTMEQDVKLLSQEGVDVVFAPSVKEMYPAGIVLDVSQQQGTFVEVKGMSHQMEGSIRPHFFRGVATVVTKLFNIVQPTRAYFGQKDGQQCAVVRSMVRDLLVPTEVVICETIRERDGLAMSSRNRYLSEKDRAAAPILYKALETARLMFLAGEKNVNVLIDAAKAVIATESHVKLEYVSIANPFNLTEEHVVGPDGGLMCGAVKVGATRIIDNVLLGVHVEQLKGSTIPPQ